jgi:hypothetical protein
LSCSDASLLRSIAAEAAIWLFAISPDGMSTVIGIWFFS